MCLFELLSLELLSSVDFITELYSKLLIIMVFLAPLTFLDCFSCTKPDQYKYATNSGNCGSSNAPLEPIATVLPSLEIPSRRQSPGYIKKSNIQVAKFKALVKSKVYYQYVIHKNSASWSCSYFIDAINYLWKQISMYNRHQLLGLTDVEKLVSIERSIDYRYQ